MIFGDLRDQMHPRIAAAVPSTPEAQAILRGESYKQVTFGGLLSNLVEVGAVEAGSFDDIRAQAIGILGISEQVFTELLHDGQPISKRTAEKWSEDYQKSIEHQVKKSKFDEVHSHFKSGLASGITQEQQQMLEDMLQNARNDTAALEAEIGELDENGMPIEFRKLPLKMKVDSVNMPFLRKLERSTYMMNLADLAERLRDDDVLFAHGPEFADEVISNGFIHSDLLTRRVDSLDFRNFATYWSGDPSEEVENSDIERLKNIWLPESFIVEELAGAYVYAFYSRYNKNAPGRDNILALPNPVQDALFVSQEERQAFLSAYPLANGQRPRYR